MGAFNVLRADVACSNCGEIIHKAIQFKYGDKWQLEYEIGDVLRWGGNDAGVPGATRVRVEGVTMPGACPACDFEDESYPIIVERDVIKDVRAVPYESLGIPAGKTFSVEDS